MKNITLYDYQQKLLQNLILNKRNIIHSSRQMGISTTLAIYMASLISNRKNIGILSHKEMISNELLNKIKDTLFKEISQDQILYNNRTKLELKNGGKVEILPIRSDYYKKYERGGHNQIYDLDVLLINNYESFNNDWIKNIEVLIKNTSDDCKIIIDSKVSLKNKKDYFITKIHWSEHPTRNSHWAEEMKRNIGELAFDVEFNLIDLNSISLSDLDE